MTTLTLKTYSRALAGDVAYFFTRQAFPFKGTIKSNMGTFFANVTVNWLTTVPDLTAVPADHDKTGNATHEVHPDNTGTCRDLREVRPILEAYSLNCSINT